MYNLSGDNGISRDELVTMFNSIRGDTVPVRAGSSRSLCCERQLLNQILSVLCHKRCAGPGAA